MNLSEILKGFGIEDTKVTAIEEAINKVLPLEFIPKNKFNEVNDKAKLLSEKVTSYEAQISETGKMLKDSEEFKTKFSQLQEQYKKDLSAKDREILNIVKRNVIKEALNKEGAKHTDLLLKEIDFEKIVPDETGKYTGLNEVVTNLKSTYSDLFTVTQTKPNETANDTPASKDVSKVDWSTKLKGI